MKNSTNKKTIKWSIDKPTENVRARLSRFIAFSILATVLPLGRPVNAAVQDPGSYMVGQHIATYEEMGIHSLLKKYQANTLDPADLINAIYDRIELNDANDRNPILISAPA